MQIGRYQILDRLGSGGMGEVYRALAQGVDGFQKPVVIKRIHKHLADRPDLASQFINEAKIAMGLLHGNVVQVLDLGKLEDEYYIALEYIDGRDVRDLIRRCRELHEWIPQEIALYIVASVLVGLDYAHRRCDLQGRPLGIVHRDVTPANILCSYEGEVKLADFGIARALTLQSDTMPGGVKGSLRYMSPEQALGRPVDQRADIFSVGVNLYFLLCGDHPYGEDNVFAVAQRVRDVRFTPPSERGVELPEELESIVLTAMAADPDDRYQTAAAMLAALEGYQRSVAHATASDLRAFMQRLFEPESQRRSWTIPPPDPLSAQDSLVGTAFEVLEAKEPPRPGEQTRVDERLRRALRVEGPSPLTQAGSSPRTPLQSVPTASDSASGQGWGRSDPAAEAHAETVLDLSSASGRERPPSVASAAASPSAARPPARDPLPSAPPDPRAADAEGSGRSATDAVQPGGARGIAIVAGVALLTAALGLGGLYLATRAGGAPESGKGRLTVRSRPPGATVLLDGKQAGTAPLTLELALGSEHRLGLERAGLRPWSEAIRLAADAPRRTLVIELAADLPARARDAGATIAARPDATVARPPPIKKVAPPAGRGWVLVSTKPAWAEVHVAGRKLDVTPCRIQLPAGPHVLTLVNPGLKRSERRRVVVRADREVELTLTDFK